MPRWTPEAKERERQTRAQLGPRIGRGSRGGHHFTAEPRPETWKPRVALRNIRAPEDAS
jgi:hypothetical protein